MRKMLPGLVAACLVPLLAQAVNEHFKTLKVGDEVFRDVTVTEVTPTDVYFTHSGGMGNAKLKRLSPQLQQQFGFNPEKAADVERSRHKGAEVYAARMQEERKLDFERAETARRQAALEEAVAKQRLRQPTGKPRVPGRWVDKKAPPLVVEKWLTPKPHPQGKFVLIDFWATWCGPCRQSIPHLNAMQKKFSDRLVVIGLSSEPEADVRGFINPKLKYSSAIDPQGRMAARLGVTAIPHSLLIDPSGTVRYEGHPALLKDNLVEAILDRFGS